MSFTLKELRLIALLSVSRIWTYFASELDLELANIVVLCENGSSKEAL